MDEKTIARFWSKVNKSGPTPAHMRYLGACWLWQGTITKHGYGQFHISHRARMSVHRFAWTITYGEIAEGVQVLHRCDRRSCSRPNHLMLGDHLLNMADMRSKQRQAKGDRVAQAILTEQEAREIRTLFRQGLSQKEICSKTGRHKATVNHILRGRCWKHLGPPLVQATRRLTPAIVQECRALHDVTGATPKEFAARFGVSATSISSAISGRRWRSVAGPTRTRRVGNFGPKLSKKDAQRIIALLNRGHMPRDIAPQFGITANMVSAIKCGKVWRQLPR